MSARKWYSGPPPSIGWWPASVNRDPDVLRYWNGEWWSLACRKGDSLSVVKLNASLESTYGSHIQWAKRPKSWPKESRA